MWEASKAESCSLHGASDFIIKTPFARWVFGHFLLLLHICVCIYICIYMYVYIFICGMLYTSVLNASACMRICFCICSMHSQVL